MHLKLPPRASLGALLFLGVGIGPALAQNTPASGPVTPSQSASPTAPVRDPIRGDAVGSTPAPAANLSASDRAAALARADKQPEGTENGNAPDRAMAGVGGQR